MMTDTTVPMTGASAADIQAAVAAFKRQHHAEYIFCEALRCRMREQKCLDRQANFRHFNKITPTEKNDTIGAMFLGCQGCPQFKPENSKPIPGHGKTKAGLANERERSKRLKTLVEKKAAKAKEVTGLSRSMHVNPSRAWKRHRDR
jgi:hypothetical protein